MPTRPTEGAADGVREDGPAQGKAGPAGQDAQDGPSYRDIAAEFARRYNLRPRAAWREAYGWSLQETADQINDFRGQVGLDPGGFAGMTAPHLCEHENWPGYGSRPSGRRPTPYLLAILAAVYDCAVRT